MTKQGIIVFTLFFVFVSVAASFKKCCPQGEVFSGSSKINCSPAPMYASEFYALDQVDENVTQSSPLPICEDPQDITTVPLSEIQPDDFLQVASCVEILYDQNNGKSIPLFVYCKSNKDRNEQYPTAASRPKVFNLRRCCTNNAMFNITTGDCEPTFDSFDKHDLLWKERFRSLLPQGDELDFLNVYRGFPKCPAIFTYEIDAYLVTFSNGSLQASLPGEKNEATDVILTERNACFEVIPDDQLGPRLLARVCRDPKICPEYGCIKKCCQTEEGARFLENRDGTTSHACKMASTSLNFYEEISNITKRPWNATEYGLFFGLKCSNSMYYMTPNEIQEITPEGYIQAYKELWTVPYDQYCIDVFDFKSKNLSSLIAFRCFEQEEEVEKSDHIYVVSTILEGISCFFILLTLLVYACLPALQNLHGKTLMCHCASLFMAYLCLSIIPWITPNMALNEENQNSGAFTICSSIGFAMLFFFLSAFCWLNVMCFDIWRTFGSLHGSISRSQNQNKRFLLYLLYAWGLSISIALLAIIIDKMDYLPSSIRPNFGTQSCWFDHWQSNYSELIFFRGPVAIQLTLNVIFFILTAEKCSKVKAEISKVVDPQDPRSKRFHSAKIRFIMNMKLFVVMGISWIAEMLPSFLQQYTNFYREIFYVADVLNSLQGLLIFILFVMKRRVYQALKKRLGLESRKSTSSQATSMLQDPFRMRKSASNSTLTSSVAVSGAP